MPITWKRPSGSEITTNDDPQSIAQAESMGWVRVDAPVAPAAPTPSPEDEEDDLELDQDPPPAKKKKKGIKAGTPDWLK